MLFEVAVRRKVGELDVAVAFSSDAVVTALVGPSGAGKTSLLNMMAGILTPERGRIVVGGQVLFESAAGIDVPPDQRRCGYVFQDGRLFPHLTVRANLLYGQRPASPDRPWIGYDEVVEILGIAALADRKPRSLSGGEARRVAIGRALLSEPAFLLLDEPLTSLDPARRDDLLAALERIRDQWALPTLYVSHQEEEVRRIATRVIAVGT